MCTCATRPDLLGTPIITVTRDQHKQESTTTAVAYITYIHTLNTYYPVQQYSIDPVHFTCHIIREGAGVVGKVFRGRCENVDLDPSWTWTAQTPQEATGRRRLSCSTLGTPLEPALLVELGPLAALLLSAALSPRLVNARGLDGNADVGVLDRHDTTT